VDALVVLVFKLGQNRVSNERKVEVEGKVQKKDREGIVAHQEPAASSSSIGGAMVSSCGSLAASLLGFWGGKREWTKGFIKACLAWMRGKGLHRNRIEIREDFLGARRVRPRLSSRDDMWGHPVSV
jgi:hypothetical protein